MNFIFHQNIPIQKHILTSSFIQNSSSVIIDGIHYQTSKLPHLSFIPRNIVHLYDEKTGQEIKLAKFSPNLIPNNCILGNMALVQSEISVNTYTGSGILLFEKVINTSTVNIILQKNNNVLNDIGGKINVFNPYLTPNHINITLLENAKLILKSETNNLFELDVNLYNNNYIDLKYKEDPNSNHIKIYRLFVIPILNVDISNNNNLVKKKYTDLTQEYKNNKQNNKFSDRLKNVLEHLCSDEGTNFINNNVINTNEYFNVDIIHNNNKKIFRIV